MRWSRFTVEEDGKEGIIPSQLPWSLCSVAVTWGMYYKETELSGLFVLLYRISFPNAMDAIFFSLWSGH